MENFGAKLIDADMLERFRRLTGEVHLFLRRNVFFAHRDLDKALDDYEKGGGFFLYTGRGPSGPMHIGHIIPFLFTRWLQERFGANLYIQITDDEKYLEERRGLSYEDAQRFARENILDIAAIGFDEDKTFIFRDTEYMGKIYPLVIRIAKRISFSNASAVFGFSTSTNIGLLFFPAIQIAPTFFKRKLCLIPSAIDQDPYWRLQRDIAGKLGYRKAATVYSKFLPPLTGPHGKMSTSRPETAIYLDDPPGVIRRKIMRYAFSGGQPTVELHRKLGGNPDVDVSFLWLYMLFEQSDGEIRRIEEEYRRGRLLSGELKEILAGKIIDFVEQHRERREEAREKLHLYMYEGELAEAMWRARY